MPPTSTLNPGFKVMELPALSVEAPPDLIIKFPVFEIVFEAVLLYCSPEFTVLLGISIFISSYTTLAIGVSFVKRWVKPKLSDS